MPVTGSAGRVWVEVPASGLESAGGAATLGRIVVAARGGPAEHPWDQAHRVAREAAAGGLEAAAPVYAEPDVVQGFPHERPADRALESLAAPPCADEPPDDFWPVGTPAFGWHLDADHSGLKAARDRVGDPTGPRVRVAILDTGYDPAHVSAPLHLNADLAQNFVDGDPADATDPARHFPGNQPGHGTATLALLAGRRVALPRGGFDDFLGGAPHAEVVPVRIADSVIHFRTSSMVAGLDYATRTGCAVVSISMGGVPTRAWADAVNRAYEAGVTIVAAAGNRFGPSPPSSIIYPARFNRVIAACGVTADGSPYYRPGLHRHMQGCFGPPAKMGTALAAYTPNAPWAVIGCSGQVGFGGGTSSATPQIAAAAALWLQAAAVPPGAEPWQRVEAVRWALFSSAAKDVPHREQYFGQGLLRAAAALDVPFRADLAKTPADVVSFPWLRLLGALEAAPVAPTGEQLMFEVEALQIYLQSPHLQDLAGGADPQADRLAPADRKKLIEALRASPMVSTALRGRLTEVGRQI
jgi:subtilisin family serine protease